MKITQVETYTAENLIERLRSVTMLKAPEVKVYSNAFISLENIHVRRLSPPQNYILRDELKKVRELKWELSRHGVDLFQLNGFVRITIQDYDEQIDVLPPIVEESIEADGSAHYIVNDGMHRVYMALREWVIPQVALIRGVPRDLPYYAFPIPGGWDKVEERDDLPDDYIKKWHRIANYYSLYRNFNSSFENVGGPRKAFKK